MPHRYLVQFGPKQIPHRFTDNLVVTKDAVQQSSSNYAQGGMAGVMSPEDRFGKRQGAAAEWHYTARGPV